MAEDTLRKPLGIFALVMINIIAIDNLRSLPFSAEYGFSLVGYYLMTMVAFFVPIALVSAQLATSLPSRGGIYVWVREAFGERWGLFVIWLQWIYNVVWYPTILAFIASILATLVNPSLQNQPRFIVPVILVGFWLATLVNCLGMRLSSWVSTAAALFGTLIPMMFIMILGGVWLWQGHPLQMDVSWSAMWPNFSEPSSWGFLLAIAFGLVGIEMSAAHADEVENPGHAYPRAILISSLIIFVSLVGASLAVAMVVPKTELNVVTGMVQAFHLFLSKYQLDALTNIMAVLIVLGGLGGVATWIIGPTKGLMVAAQDGSAPPSWAQTNRHGAPIVLLFIQGGVFTVLSVLFLTMPSVKSTYWVLTVITTQLSLLVYVGLFLAALKLPIPVAGTCSVCRVPGGQVGLWVTCLVGILSCIGIIALGFFPPPELKIVHTLHYQLGLLLGMVVMACPPFLLMKARQAS